MAEPLNLYQKLAAITGDIGIIKKDGRNNEQKFDFIEYAAVSGRLRTLFAQYGVVVIPRMVKATKQTREAVTSKYGAKGEHVLVDMSFQVVNADKPDDKFTVTWTGEAIDYGDKSTNKAATSALKYYLMRQFNISEKGEDPDEQSPDRGDAQGVRKNVDVKTAKPVAAPRSASPKLATAAQITMMANAAKRASGLESRDELLAFFKDEVGKMPNEVMSSDVGGILKRFYPADAASDEATP